MEINSGYHTETGCHGNDKSMCLSKRKLKRLMYHVGYLKVQYFTESLSGHLC